MRKKRLAVSIATALLAVCLAGCGGGTSGIRSDAKMTSNDYNYEYSAADSAAGVSEYETGGDYSSANISGDYADYSYDFNAEGETQKSRQDMLDYYDSLQKIVDENEGYIENVNNNYNAYHVAADATYITDAEKAYKATGYLQFTVQIPNDKVSLVTDSLEKFCQDNHFMVTTYNQRIYNYKNHKIVDEEDLDDDSWYGEEITQEELDRRLKYADINVMINYYIPRSGMASFGYGLRQIAMEFKDTVSSVIVVALCIALVLLIIYLEIMLFYKWFRRMMFKHKQKKPQYYAPREISIVPHTPGNFKGKVPEGMQPSLGMQMPDQEQGAQNPNGKIN